MLDGRQYDSAPDTDVFWDEPSEDMDIKLKKIRLHLRNQGADADRIGTVKILWQIMMVCSMALCDKR